MKISYKWIKEYIKDLPGPEEVAEAIILHAFEVESVEKTGDDFIFDIKILPDRAHDCLSHQGIVREISGILGLEYKLPEYRVPESQPTNLKIEIKSEKCRRYMGRIIRNVKVGPSPDWVKNHLESIGQRSINNIVDAANIVMYDCGQPIHAFDLNKLDGSIIIRPAKEGERITTLDNKEIQLKTSNMVIADSRNILAIAGVKGGKIAEVDANTKDIVLEVANFDPISVRKTAQTAGIFTDAAKRFENDLSPELCDFAMKEISALLLDYGGKFEEIVDIYPRKQEVRKLSFKTEKISKILGISVSADNIRDILKRYNFEYEEYEGNFEITVPPLRFDLVIEEDMAEEIGRILGYDKVKEKLPEINFKPEANETYSKILQVRSKLLADGYSEVMTYVFRDKGEIEVLASASDKKFLRTNLNDGLKESLKLNQSNAPLLEMNKIKIFEIGTVFLKDREEMHVAFGDKNGVREMKLEDFIKSADSSLSDLVGAGDFGNREPGKNNSSTKFKMWSVYPFISRDIAVWVPEKDSSEKILKIIKENGTGLLVKEPYIFDSFSKDGKISYAFRLVFQSYERTLTDSEINEIMAKIDHKIRENSSWQVR